MSNSGFDNTALLALSGLNSREQFEDSEDDILDYDPDWDDDDEEAFDLSEDDFDDDDEQIDEDYDDDDDEFFGEDYDDDDDEGIFDADFAEDYMIMLKLRANVVEHCKSKGVIIPRPPTNSSLGCMMI